jgi:hypothetical protein
MTMPAERTRALRWAGEFMRELLQSDKIDPAMKREVQVILRHSPSGPEIQAQAQYDRNAAAIYLWLAPEDLL